MGWGLGWEEFEGRKKITSPLLEECDFPSRAWPQTHRRHTDKSLACVTRLGKNLGRGQNCLVWPGSCRVAVTSPTPHFPLHVYSFPHRSPWGVGTLLSCEGLVCGFACGCGGVRGALHSVCLSVCLVGPVGTGQRDCRGGFCHLTFVRRLPIETEPSIRKSALVAPAAQ